MVNHARAPRLLQAKACCPIVAGRASRVLSEGTMKVGIIGAGLLGTACLQRLIGAGLPVAVYDVDEAKRAAAAKLGATAAASIDEVVRACEIIVLAVFNTDQVSTVVEGKGGIVETTGSADPRIVVCMSTCDPDQLAAIAGRVNGRVRLLEVPLSGTSRQVAEGSGVGLVGGDRAVMDKTKAVLDAICPRRYYIGAVGNGSRAKLAVNLI